MLGCEILFLRYKIEKRLSAVYLFSSNMSSSHLDIIINNITNIIVSMTVNYNPHHYL